LYELHTYETLKVAFDISLHNFIVIKWSPIPQVLNLHKKPPAFIYRRSLICFVTYSLQKGNWSNWTN